MQEWLGKVTFKEAKQFVLDASSGFLGIVSVVEKSSSSWSSEHGVYEGRRVV